MRRKNTIRIAMLMVLMLTGGMLFLRSAAIVDKNKPCKEPVQQCCKKKTAIKKPEWENLSQQFFSSI